MTLCSRGRSTLVLTFVLGLVTVVSAIRASVFRSLGEDTISRPFRKPRTFRWLLCMDAPDRESCRQLPFICSTSGRRTARPRFPATSVQWWNGAQIGDDVFYVCIPQSRIEGERHWRLQRVPVARNALPDGVTDFRFAPCADAGRSIGSDVGGGAHLGAAWAQREGATALAESVRVIMRSARPGRMAFHAMADGDEIGAVLHWIAHRRPAEPGFHVRVGLAVNRQAIDGCRHFVAHRPDAAQVGDDCSEILRQQRLVEIGRHDRCQCNAGKLAVIGAHALDQGPLDLGLAPAADPGLDIGRDVRRSSEKGGRVEGEAAGEGLVGDDLAFAIARRMAVAAGHDGVDEIITVLDRGFGARATCHQDTRQGVRKNASSQHDFPQIPEFYATPSREPQTVQRMRSRTTANRNVKDKCCSCFALPHLRVTILTYDWRGQLMRWCVSIGAVLLAGAMAGGDATGVAAPASTELDVQRTDKRADDAKPTVDVELILAVDVSYSLDMDELAVQREGYAQAIVSKEFLQALKSGPNGKISITYLEWAASSDQKIIIPWRLIDGPETADAVSAEIMKTPVRRASRTSISGAIYFAMPLFNEDPYHGLRRVIDISGDGPNNNGAPVTGARDEALSKGIVINGLPIMVKEPSYSTMDIDNLDWYYEDCVIGGPGSFVVAIKDREKFKEAIRTKLLLEVAGRVPERPVVPVADKEPRVSCLVGEKI